jgi:TolB-like protein/DNA-binding winged helix-turn-helix (wHTH) protein
MLRIGAWCVDPASGDISRDGEANRLDARALLLLLYLADRPGKVVSIDELLNQVWSGVTVSPDSVYQAVTSLRRVLGDDPRQPVYIATVPRLGYRMLASVTPCSNPSTETGISSPATASSSHIENSAPAAVRSPGLSAAQARTTQRRRAFLWGAAIAALFLAFALVFLVRGNFLSRHPSTDSTAPPRNSVAVLPFLDLTEGMKEEEFADGITEELIDKLSRIPGFQVPPPTSSFYFKGKRASVADMARALGVAFVLDGSVRKSGTWVRVDVRLIRADNGYIVWSETYDQPMTDILTIQDDIAGKVTQALKASIASDQNKSK